ncbi:hypothetical protein ATX60_09715 [Oenococcus oeni]|uniref:siphovirus Gp157 family protein n=1 Tax=Oenococcus oeni TaxID=1247 RepID=UPI0008F90603|nr:siphovirus Gp157 family protein [Oenococcus oeni]OIM22385.1 hypothetical protein ATX60_09715 [Oenococcus oeni]
MTKLYNLAQNYRAVDELDDSQISEQVWFDTLDAIDETLNDKIENIALFVKEKKSDIDQIDKLINELQGKKATINKSINWLKDYLKQSMKVTGKEKYKSTLNSLYFMHTKQVVVENEDIINDDYKKIIKTLDRSKIKKSLKEGKTIVGAELKENESLVIR